MNPVEIAAIISGCFGTASVGLTAYVAVRGFRSTKEATNKAIESSSQDTIRALNAARDDRLWEKRATVYEETVAYLLYTQRKRDFRSADYIAGFDTAKAIRFWFGEYRPPGWGAIQGRLVAYASDAIMEAYKASGNADNEAAFRFSVWKTAYDRAKKKPDLDSTDDDPAEVKAKNKLYKANKIANEKSQVLIDLIRNELHSRPSVR